MYAIRQRREELGLTQLRLAELLNVSQGTISQWENGSKTPSVDNLIALAKELRCSTDLLVGLAE